MTDREGDSMFEVRDQYVLIVDDARTDLMLLAKVLEAPGRHVLTARSGEEALGLVGGHDLALVIMDVQMPGLDGYETAERIRGLEAGRHVPIIFVTGTQKDQDHVFRGYDSGAVDYLLKPVPGNLLRHKVDVFCELHLQKDIIGAQLREIRAKNEELQRRLDEIKVLRGLIPICASCKKVRDDDGLWEAIETYLEQYSEAEFSHSICPDCTDRLYPELNLGGVRGG